MSIESLYSALSSLFLVAFLYWFCACLSSLKCKLHSGSDFALSSLLDQVLHQCHWYLINACRIIEWHQDLNWKALNGRHPGVGEGGCQGLPSPVCGFSCSQREHSIFWRVWPQAHASWPCEACLGFCTAFFSGLLSLISTAHFFSFIYFFLINFLAALWGIPDLSSRTRNWTHAPLQWKRRILTAEPLGKSPHFLPLNSEA